MRRLRRWAGACALIAMAVLSGLGLAWPVRADTYPDKPVRVLVGFPPGGAAYMSPFLVAKYLSETLGQNFLMDPRPGGNTIIAAGAAAVARPDGYTLLAASNSTMAVNPQLYAGKLPYDADRAFAPIGRISRFPFFLCVPARLSVPSLAAFVALAKAQPLNYASNGSGTVGHLATEMFKRAAGIALLHVPYKAYIQALPDLLSGQISSMMCDLSVTGAHIQAGDLRPLAVTTEERSRFLPAVPTMAEAGYPTVEAEVWLGLFAPAGTPPAIIARLGDAMRRFLTSPQAAEEYKTIGQEPAPSSPEALRALIGRDAARYGEIIRAAHIQVD
jgi:tripartite-type tricarboxylate transporter receptor subunit TctC